MPEAEVFELDTGGAEKLARKFRATEESPDVADDPCPHIAPSLLSADHILEYVRETGLVAPFSSDTSKKGRLKKASYEARLGDSAYSFEVPGGKKGSTGADPKPLDRNKAGNLVLPPNSIVFVQCDLEFRLPSFIALRFNLSISHVHRGLLLGTGPLVDPGFWGNLCIPIHNLTDEEYEIEPDDGLIWIEFTKTTSSTKIGRLPSGDGSWDIKKFIEKAQKQVDPSKDRVGIRSGISQALGDAQKAAELINESREAAKTAEETTKKFFNRGLWGGGIAALAVVISVFALAAMYYMDMDSHFTDVRPAIRELEVQFSEHIDRIDVAGQTDSEAQATISKLSEMVAGLQESVSNLTDQLETERTEREKAEAEMREAREASERQIGVLREGVSNLCSFQENEELKEACLGILAEPN